MVDIVAPTFETGLVVARWCVLVICIGVLDVKISSGNGMTEVLVLLILLLLLLLFLLLCTVLSQRPNRAISTAAAQSVCPCSFVAHTAAVVAVIVVVNAELLHVEE